MFLGILVPKALAILKFQASIPKFLRYCSNCTVSILNNATFDIDVSQISDVPISKVIFRTLILKVCKDELAPSIS